MNVGDLNPGSFSRFSNRESENEIDLEQSELIELPEISRLTDSIPQEAIQIEINEDELIPFIQKYDKCEDVHRITVTNCNSKSIMNEALESLDIEDEFMDLKTIIFITFQINESSCFQLAFTVTELEKSMNNWSKNSIIIQIASRNHEQFMIYWRPTNDSQFFSLKPIENVNAIDNKILHEYIVDFLITSMKNGHSGIIKNVIHKSGATNVEINFLADSRDFQLLLQACEKGNADIVRITLAIGMNTNLHGTNIDAQHLAMAGNHYDVILELIKANQTFPEGLNNEEAPLHFQEVCKAIEELHEHIKFNNVDEIKKILEKDEKIYFYNMSNESALKVAILNQSMEAYELLLSKKLRFGPHENAEEILQTLDDQNKRIAREIHDRHKQNSPENHINVLLSNSFICHDELDPSEKLKLVNHAYRTLNMNAFIQIILLIVAASKKFKIIFDFNRESVSVADPTVEEYTQGLFYPSGRIYIGAKQLLDEATQNETLATIAHELCHFAMNLVYRNDARPYTKNDHQTMQEFEKISEKCRENSKREGFIDLVYSSYPEDMHHAELVVRVVHLMALYRSRPEMLQEVNEIFSELFEFYEKKIFPELKMALPEIEQRDAIELRKKEITIFKYKILVIVGSVLGLIAFIIAAFIMHSIFNTPIYVFKDLSELDKIKVKNAPVNYKNVQLKFNDLFPENHTVYQNLTSEHISQMLESKPLNFNDSHLHYLDEEIVHEWEKMSTKLKRKVLNSTFNFQNENLRLASLNEVNPEVFKSLSSMQILDILNDVHLNVGHMIANKTKFYVARKITNEQIFGIYYAFMVAFKSLKEDSKNGTNFSFEEYYYKFLDQDYKIYSQKIADYMGQFDFKQLKIPDFKISDNETLVTNKLYNLNFDDIIQQAQKDKIFILSSKAGMGKTVTFKQLTLEIKKNFPERWVSYIDLKDFTKFYNKTEKVEGIEKLLEDILDLSAKNEFERKIFEEFFWSGNVILLWNGFDEISPEYSNFILNVTGLILNQTSNIQFICTRPLYSEHLRNFLNISSHELIPLDIASQEEFLSKFFISQNVNPEKIPDYFNKVFKILNSLSNLDSSGGVDTPLMLQMIADLISSEDEIYETENLYQIYQKFISKKIKVWQNKSEVGREISNNLIAAGHKFSMIEIYQKYSLMSYGILNTKDDKKLKIMRQKVPKELTKAEISRMGILFINDENKIEFAHRTFQEFYIAQYFVDFIYNADEVSSDEAARRTDLFCRVVDNYNGNNVIIMFMSSYLETHDAIESENFNPTISDFLAHKLNEIMFRAFLGLIPSFEFLVHFLKKNHKLLFNLLHYDGNMTIYTGAYTYTSDHLDENSFNLDRSNQKKLVQSVLTEHEYDVFIHGKNQKGIILCSQYIYYSIYSKKLINDAYTLNDTILEDPYFRLFNFFKQELTQDEINEFFISHKSPIYEKDIDAIENAFQDMEDIFPKEEFVNFLKIKITKHQKTYLIDSNIIFLFNRANALLSDSEILELFTADIFHSTHINYGFENAWSVFANHTNDQQQREVLNEKSGDGQYNVCVGNLIYNNLDDSQFEYIMKLCQRLFHKSDIQGMILKSNWFLNKILINTRSEDLSIKLNYIDEIFEGNQKEFGDFLKSSRDISKVLKKMFQKLNKTDTNLYNEVKSFSDFYNLTDPSIDIL